MKRFALGLVMALVVAACSTGGGSDTTTTTSAAGGGAGSSTTAPAATTSAGAETTTTTTIAAASSADCVVGAWEMDAQAFFDQVFNALPPEDQVGEFVHKDGVYRITLGADGSILDQRIDWTFAVTSDFGDLEMIINDERTGTYTVDGATISSNMAASTTGPEVQVFVDGQPFAFPGGVTPVEPPDASFFAAAFTCDGDLMTVAADDITSTWQRVG